MKKGKWVLAMLIAVLGFSQLATGGTGTTKDKNTVTLPMDSIGEYKGAGGLPVPYINSGDYVLFFAWVSPLDMKQLQGWLNGFFPAGGSVTVQFFDIVDHPYFPGKSILLVDDKLGWTAPTPTPTPSPTPSPTPTTKVE